MAEGALSVQVPRALGCPRHPGPEVIKTGGDGPSDRLGVCFPNAPEHSHRKLDALGRT